LSLKNGEEAKIAIDDEGENEVCKEKLSYEDEPSSIAGRTSEDIIQIVHELEEPQNSDDLHDRSQEGEEGKKGNPPAEN
jgi:hypothetical protein